MAETKPKLEMLTLAVAGENPSLIAKLAGGLSSGIGASTVVEAEQETLCCLPRQSCISGYGKQRVQDSRRRVGWSAAGVGPIEDNEQREVLVRGEAMVCSCGNEQRAALL